MTPALRLAAYVTPTSIPASPTDYAVTVRLDVTTPGAEQGGVARPLNLALLIDKSGSMGNPPEKIQTARVAAARVVDLLADADTFCLVAFSTTHEVLVKASRVGGNRDAIKAAIGRLQPEATTRLQAALDATAAELRPHRKEGVLTAVYALTDGVVDDAADSLKAAAGLIADGVEVWAGGIGADWKLDFLDQFTADPKKVKPLTLATLPDMIAEFERFVRQKGHVVTANCRLAVEVPARRVRVTGVIADRMGNRRPLPLDPHGTVALPNLPAGVTADFVVQLVVAPGGPRDIPVHFRLRYDLPAAGLVNQIAEVTADLRVTDNAAEVKPHPMVDESLRNIQETRLSEQAEEALKNKDIGRATAALGRLTGVLRQTGRMEEAAAAEALQKEVVQAAEGGLDEVAKNARRMTGRLTQ